MDLADARLEHFSARLGEGFHVGLGDDESCDLTLVEAGPIRGSESAFSLIFHGPSHVPLSQNTYALEHPDLGRLPIFLVPVSQQEEGFLYEAVFSRLDDDA